MPRSGYPLLVVPYVREHAIRARYYFFLQTGSLYEAYRQCDNLECTRIYSHWPLAIPYSPFRFLILLFTFYIYPMELSITLIIVIITALVSLGAFNNQKMMDDLIFYPPAVSQRNQWYRFFSCGLIHADWGHLIFNMLALYLFGRTVEVQFAEIFQDKGKPLYLLMYIVALAVSILPTYFKNKNNSNYRSLGASGAVSAVIFAGLLIAPYTEVFIFFIPIPIPGFVFAPLYLIISAILDKKGAGNINHSAHIWGALFGLAFVIVLGKLIADFDAISYCIEGIKLYMKTKGWT